MRKAVGTDRKRDPQRVLDVLARNRRRHRRAAGGRQARRRARRRRCRIQLIDDHGLYQPRFNVIGVALHKRTAIDRRLPRPPPTDRSRLDSRNLGWHGNAILVKSHVERARLSKRSTLPTLEPRGAVMAELLVGDMADLRVIGMHLDLSGLWRRRQVVAILDAHRSSGTQRCRRS